MGKQNVQAEKVYYDDCLKHDRTFEVNFLEHAITWYFPHILFYCFCYKG